jgi:hypothetical protein
MDYQKALAEEAEAAVWEQLADDIGKGADISMDILAEFTGEKGKKIKEGYAFLKTVAQRGSEAYYRTGSAWSGIAQGAVEGGNGFAQGKAESYQAKALAQIAGEAAKEGLDNYMKDKSITEGLMTGAGKGVVNFAVEGSMDALGKGLNKLGDKISSKLAPDIRGSDQLMELLSDEDLLSIKLTGVPENMLKIANFQDAAKAGLGDVGKNVLQDMLFGDKPAEVADKTKEAASRVADTASRASQNKR